MKSWIRDTRRMTLVLGAMLVFAAAIGPVRAEVLDEGALLSLAQIEDANDHLMGVLALEPKALAAAGNSVSREGDRLTLRVRSGSVKSYADRPECMNIEQESKCEKFRLVAYAPSRHLFVVAHAGYETVRYIVVDDATGDETSLRALPLFSPSGDHILVLNIDDERLGFAMQLWARSGHKFDLKWTAAPFAHATPTSMTTYRLLGWNSEKALAVEAETRDDSPAPRTTKRFVVHESAGEWQAIEAP